MPWLQPWLRKWQDLSLRAKCLLLIAFPAAAMVLIFGVSNILAARYSAANEQVSSALRIGQQIQLVNGAEAETSANVRGYFITAQESFVSRTRSSLAAFDSAAPPLLSLTLLSPSQQQRLAQIVSIQHAREERMCGDIARFRSGELPGDQLRAALRKVEVDQLHMQDMLASMQQDNAGQ